MTPHNLTPTGAKFLKCSTRLYSMGRLLVRTEFKALNAIYLGLRFGETHLRVTTWGKS